MTDLITSISELQLVAPDPERDAIFAFAWFNQDAGRDTLLKMGNAPSEIETPSLEGERATIQEFIELEQKGIQTTWMMRYASQTIGAAWIDEVVIHGVKAPSIHLMIGDPKYRSKGLGRATLQALLQFLKSRGEELAYSRYLVSNTAIEELLRSIGFVTDGEVYSDENGLEWQHVIGKV